MTDLARIAEDLKREEGAVKEGSRHVVYKDHLGNDTICWGHLLSRGFSDRVASIVLSEDIMECMADLNREIPWWQSLPEGPQCALVEMCFQMGWPSLRGFRRMLEALMEKDYEAARRHALDSKWARRDTPERAKRVAAMIRGVEV